MKFLVIFAFTLATAFYLPDEEIKSRNIVVPVGKPQGRITRGKNARKGQFPYQAGLDIHYSDGNTSSCGGTLISNTEIITAAHCVEDVAKVEVILGTISIYSINISYEVPSSDIITHPNYNTTTLDNDIAIIKIPYTNYSSYIQPAQLPTASTSLVGNNVVASGWGQISDYVTGLVPHLQYADMVVISNKFCKFFFDILPSQLCVSTLGQVSICDGDSGGPLVLQNSSILVGITSYANIKCQNGEPAVFTRISSFLDWIKQNSNVNI